jgi:hypothetical protein
MPVPPLNGCNSWIVVHKGTLASVIELYDAGIVSCVDADRFDVLAANDYLQRYNASVSQ